MSDIMQLVPSSAADSDVKYDLAYDRMTALIETMSRVDEVKDIRDKAEALRVYARQAGESLRNQNRIAAIKLRAERRIGELLKEVERTPAGRPPKIESTMDLISPYQSALADNNIAASTAQRFQALTTIPAEIFEQTITAMVESDEYAELTTNLMLRKAQEIKRQKKAEGLGAPPPLPTQKYRVWYADPPWKYGNAGVIGETDNYGHVARHYPAMSIEELCAMGPQIREACEPDAVLFMWVTSPLLEECFPVIEAWGFKYKTSFVWDKVGHNYGHYNSVRHEFLLVCTRGSCTPDAPTLYDSVVSVEKSRKHSEKPEEFRRMIESLYLHGKRIELFARSEADGWDTWGNERA